MSTEAGQSSTSLRTGRAARASSILTKLMAKGGPWLVLLIAIVGAAIFWKVMDKTYPVDKWLFWAFAKIWLFTLLFGLAAVSGGDFVLGLLGIGATLRERAVLAFAIGTFVFGAGLFVAGLFHALGAVFFWGWPILLIASGAGPWIARLRRLWHFSGSGSGARIGFRPRWSIAAALALAFGVLGVFLIYVPIMTPANTGYDAHWYHLAMAEHYAAGGAVTRFPEGMFQAAYPHFSSYLYTWAFLVPRSDLFTRIELAAHIEFLLFVVTLVGIGVAVRWCTEGRRTPGAWAALFLFPGIFVYDSTLSCGADHVLAFFAVPILLLTRRLLRRWDVASAIALAAVMAGAVLTKYHAIYLLAGPAIAIAVRVVRELRARRWRPSAQALAPVAACVVGALLFTTPLWLKNWVWYGDPVYPMLREHFSLRPWVPDAEPDKFLQAAAWTPQGPLGTRVLDTLIATFTFSFIPHDWWNLHGTTPVFGSLFTLALPLIALGRPRRRTAVLAFATWLGIAIWFWTYHQDRYLQALLPWMSVVVAAVFSAVWSTGWISRLGIAVLVVAQLVWGGDEYAIPSHSMLGQQPAKLVLDLISGGYRREFDARFDPHAELAPVAPLLPPGSKVLVHERHLRLGLGAMSVNDATGSQAGISYALLQTPRAVHQLLLSFGVTHALWAAGSSLGWQSAAADLVFFEFVEKYTQNHVSVAGSMLGTLFAAPPPAVPEPRLVQLQLCGAARVVPLVSVDAALAGAPVTAPPESAGVPPAFAVVQAGCAPPAPGALAAYRRVAARGPFELWIRNGP